MATNKLLAAALAGVLAAVSPIAALASDHAKSTDANGCKGEANKCPTKSETKTETKTETVVETKSETGPAESDAKESEEKSAE